MRYHLRRRKTSRSRNDADLTTEPNRVPSMNSLDPEVAQVSRKNDIRPVTYLKAKAADLLKLISQGEEDIRRDRVRSQDEMFARIARAVDG